jgi:hypothetical protein
MKPLPPTVADEIGLSFLRKSLFVGTLFLTMLAVTLLLNLEKKYNSSAAFYAAGFCGLGGFFTAFIGVPTVILRMQQDRTMSLFQAIKHTFLVMF